MCYRVSAAGFFHPKLWVKIKLDFFPRTKSLSTSGFWYLFSGCQILLTGTIGKTNLTFRRHEEANFQNPPQFSLIQWGNKTLKSVLETFCGNYETDFPAKMWKKAVGFRRETGHPVDDCGFVLPLPISSTKALINIVRAQKVKLCLSAYKRLRA